MYKSSLLPPSLPFRFFCLQTNDVKKTLQVPKGKGTALEDMPNVASKLGRLTRNSPIVGHLHNLIFGGKAKVWLLVNLCNFLCNEHLQYFTAFAGEWWT